VEKASPKPFLAMARLAALSALISLALAVSPEELESFLYSTSGLDMSRSDAQNIAVKEAPILTQSMVTVTDLKNLREVLYNPSYLDYSRSELKEHLLSFAEQHLSPADLKDIYSVLYHSVGVSKAVAKSATLQLVRNKADPTQVKSLYDLLKAVASRIEAQTLAIELGAAGCDPVALKNSYTASRDLPSASSSAVRANLNGEVRRYASDGKVYSVSDFQSWYGGHWLTEWAKAPLAKKVAEDGKEYVASEFRSYFGSSWESKWMQAQVSTQMRLAEDGKAYSIQDFAEYYKDGWQAKWGLAPVLLCKECRAMQQFSV